MPSSASAGWPAPGVSVRRVTFPRGVTEADALSGHCVSLHVGASVSVDCSCDGVRHRGLQSPGRFDIAPAGSRGRWEDAAETRTILVTLSPSLLLPSARAMGLKGDQITLAPRFQVHDPAIAHIVSALALAADAAAPEPLVVEGLADALAARLTARYASAPLAAARPQQMSARQARRVIDYIDANLGQRLTLEDIARAAGISASHLKVLFRRTTGRPVHRYVIERRVEFAARLIKESDVSLSDIAAASGFAHQSHMARCIRRMLGVTPSNLARELRQGLTAPARAPSDRTV